LTRILFPPPRLITSALLTTKETENSVWELVDNRNYNVKEAIMGRGLFVLLMEVGICYTFSDVILTTLNDIL